MHNILYEVKNGLYVNITNKCPCACTFCIRNTSESVGKVDSLWLSHEPSMEEIFDEFKKVNLSDYDELVFCGFGEPTERLFDMIEICKFVRNISDIHIKLNTNGLSNLINKMSTEHLFENMFDTVSISLNSPNKEKYLNVTNPCFGEKSFEEMLKFSQNVSKYVKNTVFTVVDTIPEDDINESKKLAKELGINFRLRNYYS